ncbi:MAG: hypothetical protein M3Z36_02490 [Acidobacteriota bacterium]|nr:hypothetical protein [Acidobacteriota bacterium]
MLVKAKHILSRMPVVGYGLHWLMDVLTLPLMRLDLLREIRRLQEVERQNHEGITALRRSFDDALTQLDVLYSRIMSTEGTSAGAIGNAEFRADMLRQLWTTDRRLGEIERQIRNRGQCGAEIVS